jgi:hypothetical protein
LHPLLSIIALLIGNLLLGIIGMVLAVPIAACIQIAVLAVVPKLALEIEIPSPKSTPEGNFEERQEAAAIAQDLTPTEQMKLAVATVVEDIELQAANTGTED